MKKEIKTIIWIVAVIAGLAIAYALIGQQIKFANVNVPPEEATSKEVMCDIQVANPRGIPLLRNGDLVIEAANCQQQFVRNCGRFGFFSDKGTLALEAFGGIGSSTDLKIGEGSSASYSLGWCGSKTTTSFKINLYDEKGVLLEAKEVKLI